MLQYTSIRYRVRACLFPAMGHSALIDKFTKIKRDNDKKT